MARGKGGFWQDLLRPDGRRETRRRRELMLWTIGIGGAALAIQLLVACSSTSGPRVIVLNDLVRPVQLFDCRNEACTEAVSGSEDDVKPGGKADEYWNSPDADGFVGVATIPGDLLLGCLTNPTAGQDSPPPVTVRSSQLMPCPGQRPHPEPSIRYTG